MERIAREPRGAFLPPGGRHHGAQAHPEPGPPIWVAGRSEAAMKRAARLGDGYMPYLFSPERYRDAWRRCQPSPNRAGATRRPSRLASISSSAWPIPMRRPAERANRDLSLRYNQPFDRIVDRYCVLGHPTSAPSGWAVRGGRRSPLHPRAHRAASGAADATWRSTPARWCPGCGQP